MSSPSRRTFVLALALTAFAGPVASAVATKLAPLIEKLLPRAESTQAPTGVVPEFKPDRALAAFYKDRAYKPVWLVNGQPSPLAVVVRARIESCADEGLRPEDYRIAELRKLWSRSDDDSRARLDLGLSRAFVLYTHDLHRGRMALRRLDDPDYVPDPAVFTEALKPLRKGLDATALDRYLAELAPSHPYYQQLKLALQQYRALARKGRWQPIPAGPSLKLGMTDARVAAVAERLVATGDLAQLPAAPGTRFGRELEAAVRRFQARHYLTADGVVGGGTLDAMNIPLTRRIQQIVINMERWRWISLESSGKQILVNIPGFDLVGMRDGTVELSMPVVVGKPYQQTPVFEDKLEYVEFNPSWMVPPKLIADELVPEMQKDPQTLSKKHIRIYAGMGKDAPEVDPKTLDWAKMTPAMLNRYTMRQDPGPWNVLGSVKFMFPNRYNVYFHDTSEPGFFTRHLRTFSHGCIRVSRPHDLAVWVLDADTRGPWNAERIQATIANGQPTTVPLEKPIPVHLIYRTALVEGDMVVHFKPDIYGRDAALVSALPNG